MGWCVRRPQEQQEGPDTAATEGEPNPGLPPAASWARPGSGAERCPGHHAELGRAYGPSQEMLPKGKDQLRFLAVAPSSLCAQRAGQLPHRPHQASSFCPMS